MDLKVTIGGQYQPCDGERKRWNLGEEEGGWGCWGLRERPVGH